MTHQEGSAYVYDDDEEYEDEEEVLMYVGFPTFENLPIFDDPETEIEISGLEGENPTIQLKNMVLQGKHQVNVGSMMFFQDNNPSSSNNTGTTEKKEINVLGMSINYVECSLSRVIPPERPKEQEENQQQATTQAVTETANTAMELY